MTKGIKISTDSDPNSLFNKRKIRTREAKIETPIKAINLSKITEYPLPANIRGLNYIFKRIGETRNRGQFCIDDLKFDPKKENNFVYDLNGLINRSIENNINLLFIEYVGNYPEGENLREIATKIHTYSTISTVPLIAGLKRHIDDGKEKEFDKYIKFLDRYYEEIILLNDKPLMGMIPILTPTYSARLTEYYLNKGINALCIDFGGRTPSTTSGNITQILKTVKEFDGNLDNLFITSINLDPGRGGKKADAISRKDILSFGFGIDSFCDKHVRIAYKPTTSVGGTKEQEANKVRLFIKDDYGSWKVGASNLKKIYPKDTNIPFDVLLADVAKEKDNRRLQKAFNIEQLGLEALKLRNLILDQEVKKYVEKKKHVKSEDISKMEKVREDLKGGTQSALFKF